MDDIKALEYAVRGACFEVQNTLGIGFVEQVYQGALAIEMSTRGIPYEKEKHITIKYKGQEIENYYKADFVVDGQLILELKAVSQLLDEHKAQLLNYLKATGIKKGLLINFGEYPLKIISMVL